MKHFNIIEWHIHYAKAKNNFKPALTGSGALAAPSFSGSFSADGSPSETGSASNNQNYFGYNTI